MTSNYISVNLLARGKVYDAKIEQGCSFENNGSIYRADESGKLKIYEKIKGEWRTADKISMTNYQLRTFKAVANGVSEEGDNIVLSKADLDYLGNRIDWPKNEKRGGEKYISPEGWIGIGLKALDKYGENNTWLDMQNK